MHSLVVLVGVVVVLALLIAAVILLGMRRSPTASKPDIPQPKSAPRRFYRLGVVRDGATDWRSIKAPRSEV